MFLTQFVAESFRNLENLNIEFKPGLNLIWGDNAQGKTNLIEAIYFLGNLKGFRALKNSDMIQWGKSSASVGGVSISPLASQKIQIKIEPSKKTAHLNGKTAANAREFFSAFPVILLCPEELALVDKGPSGRRALLDRAVFLMENDYLDKFRRFYFVLKTRNLLLRQNKNQKELDVWTESFIETAVSIIHSRNLFLKNVIRDWNDINGYLTGNHDSIEIDHQEVDKNEIEIVLRNKIKKSYNREREVGYTIVGPHTEGPVFLLNGKQLRNFASQGQKKSFLLSFKITQILNYQKKNKKTPILLLDDFGSDLDIKRQKNFFEMVYGKVKQIFFTTNDEKILKNCGISSDNEIYIKQGKLINKI
ncbi:MAG: DNA replication/repair protein RecF [Deltaproteobacteria bacterium]|nr:DNA replication/repair protein RecF [Deltaproteobacteria bacterium]